MFAKAEAEINAVVAELGESAPMKMPDTAYYLSCIYAYLGKKVTTLGELRDTLADVKAMMTREYKTKDIFTPTPMPAPITTATSPTPRFVPWACPWSPATSPASLS